MSPPEGSSHLWPLSQLTDRLTARSPLTPPTGRVQDIDGLVLAEVVHRLGAGRSKAGQPINHSVGAELLVSVGQPVAAGQRSRSARAMVCSGASVELALLFSGGSWLRLHHEDAALPPDLIRRLQNALRLGPEDTPPPASLVEELLLPRLDSLNTK